MKVKTYQRVLELDAQPWLNLGWVEVARERLPSVSEDVLLLETDQDPAPVPAITST